jgi:hypothetical protein
MQTNRTPTYDASDNPTGCCPRFRPGGWDDEVLAFENKRFARAETRSLFHIPLNMGPVFSRAQQRIDAAKAGPGDQFIVLSRDLSPWSAEHLFAVTAPVPGLEDRRLSGRFRTRVFDGPFRDQPKWRRAAVAEMASRGETPGETWFFYTTCPKCAKAYDCNPVVAVTRIQPTGQT